MTKRRRISTKDRVALFEREGGICHLCKGLVHAGEAWDVSHDIPLELGGADDEINWKVAHRKCHREHTRTVDVPNIAKAKRMQARHIGAKAPSSRPIQSAGFKTGRKLPRIEKQVMTMPNALQRRMNPNG